MAAETSTLSPRANRATAASDAGDVGDGRRPEGVRVGEGTMIVVRAVEVRAAVGPVRPTFLSCVWPTWAGPRACVRKGRWRGKKTLPSPFEGDGPRRELTSAWPSRSAMNAGCRASAQRRRTTRVDRRRRRPTTGPRRPRPRQAVDVPRRSSRAGEVGRLLAGEVVVEPVEDEDRDQESVRATTPTNATVRRPWKRSRQEPARRRGRPAAFREIVSARRMRSRHLGPSGRTRVRPGRPRSCRADG